MLSEGCGIKSQINRRRQVPSNRFKNSVRHNTGAWVLIQRWVKGKGNPPQTDALLPGIYSRGTSRNTLLGILEVSMRESGTIRTTLCATNSLSTSTSSATLRPSPFKLEASKISTLPALKVGHNSTRRSPCLCHQISAGMSRTKDPPASLWYLRSHRFDHYPL